MNIVPFDKLKVTTMTLVMTLSGGVDPDLAFHLLPITKIDIPLIRGGGKCKLPHCPIPGSILSMRYKNEVRGVIISKSHSFKNAITIDISTTKKNVNLKLSPQSIQICGASSREDGVEAANYVLQYLRDIQQYLDFIKGDETGCKRELDWISEQTKGSLVRIDCWQPKEYANCTINVLTTALTSTIKPPTKEIPDDLNKDIVGMFLRYVHDFIYHEDLCKKLSLITSANKIIDGPIGLKTVDEAMVNYNYSLGFEIDRAKLNQLINGRHGFMPRYDNSLSTSVTIDLPYEPPATSTIKRRKSKKPHHTFLCYKSGSVTQSGPGGKLMEDVYYLFMNTIAELAPHISYDHPKTSSSSSSRSVNSSYSSPVSSTDSPSYSHNPTF